MGKLGKSYSGAGGRPFSFQAPEERNVEERAMRGELAAAVVGVICVLGVIGWALTLLG